MTARPDIEATEAIAIAAGGYSQKSILFDSDRAITRRMTAARLTIVRFLEHVPDDATVLDLREAIEEAQ
jgi:hypothetical protein